MAEKRTVLVTGATGKQGRALIHALLSPVAGPVPEYHVLALTRSTSSAPAQQLLEAEKNKALQITLKEANLDDPDSIRRIFVDAAADGGLWGVYAVLAYPGLGANADGEEAQGKMLADLALEFNVKAFVYSSSIQAGTNGEQMIDLSHKAKCRIEHYCRELQENGLNWIILRPGFFMENFEGSLGAMAFTLLHKYLPDGTTIAVIASEDIGNVAAGVFRNHEKFRHKILSATSGPVTTKEIMESYQRAMGKPMPTVPSFVVKALYKINRGAANVVKETLQAHEMQTSGSYGTFKGEMELANTASKMQTYYEWKLKSRSETGKKEERLGNWNKVSLVNLFTGRSSA